MVIRNGSGSGFPSGGVVVEGRPGRLEVSFRNVEISNNARTGIDDDGGGLRIVPTSDSVSGSLFGAMVSIDNDSAVFQNSAGGDGGGISCVSTFDHETNPITLLRLGTTLIANNEATNGGGIAIDGCRNVFLYSGGPFVLFVPTGGIISNTASVRGGGLYVTNGGEAFLGANEFAGFGDAEEAALLASNNADFGGGANVDGADSRLRIRDAYITGNTAGLFNGAISVGTSGSLVIDRLGASEACLEAMSGGGVLSRPPCSIVADNTAQFVGAIGATTGAQVDVSRTIFRNNESTDGDSVSVIRATGVDTFPRTEVNVEGGLFYDNEGDRVFESNGRATMNVGFSTITDNSNDIALVSGSSTNGNTTFDLAASIVGAASGEIIRLGGGPDEVASARCVIGDRPVNNSGFGSVTFYSDVDPEFRDRAMDDYRPGITSPALDYCDDAIAPAFVGLDGGERGVEWLGPNPTPDLGVAGGLFDLGAFEPPFTPPEIFSDRFEDMP
jgi:predicted outer membrane repeat protein